jgi:hypothetical protein
MMLRILSFFPCVLRLIEDLQRAQTDTLLLQDRLELALNDRARLWEAMQTSRAAESEALHLLINVEYQRKYGIAPFPDSMKLPPSMAAQDPGQNQPRMTAAQAVLHQTDKLIKEFEQRIHKVT